jgi:hypothetical protein
MKTGAKRQRRAVLIVTKLTENRKSNVHRLLKARARLNILLDLKRAGTILSSLQLTEAIGLVQDIKATKARLIKQGVAPEDLVNSAKLREALVKMKKIVPAPNFRSGGVGSFGQASSLKFWR